MTDLIGITLGDPKGIGPEIIAKAWRSLPPEIRDRLRIYGDANVLGRAFELARIDHTPHERLKITSDTSKHPGDLTDEESARISIAALDSAIRDAKEGKIGGFVTAPLNKHRIRNERPNFTGHTEYLAESVSISDVTMMFYAKTKRALPLCISLVTTHVPIRDVAEHITCDNVFGTIKRTADALGKYFDKSNPRIAVMSLNPHCGEDGTLGFEEKEIIEPAIRRAQSEGLDVKGPYPSDSFFHPPLLCRGYFQRDVILSEAKNPEENTRFFVAGAPQNDNSDYPLTKGRSFEFDAVISMYHDQGMLPIKLLAKGECVNITLGLPFIRTSPGHGTAEDIAWKGVADERNMTAAIGLAVELTSKIKVGHREACCERPKGAWQTRDCRVVEHSKR